MSSRDRKLTISLACDLICKNMQLHSPYSCIQRLLVKHVHVVNALTQNGDYIHDYKQCDTQSAQHPVKPCTGT